MASSTTPAAGTAHTSLRSVLAGAGSWVTTSTRAQRAAQRGERLHGGAQHQGLAVGHASLQASGAVGRSGVRPVAAADGVVHGGPARSGRGPAIAELDGLDRLHGHRGLREAPVEAAVPLGVAAEPGDEAHRDDLQQPSERVAPVGGLEDLRAHRRLRRAVEHAQRGDLQSLAELPVGHPRARVVRALVAHRADGQHARAHRDAAGREEASGHRPGRHPRRGLPSARPLEHVAQVGAVVLQRPREVGVPRTRRGHRIGRRRKGLRAHAPLPVGEVAVLDAERDGRAEGLGPSHAGLDADHVVLDLHAPAAAVAALASREVAVDVAGEERQPGGDAVDEGEEGGTVGLPSGGPAKVGHDGCGGL